MTCLIEQVDQNNGDLGNLRNALTRLELIEDQIQKWRFRFPDVLAMEEAVTAIELQEEFRAFKEDDWRRIQEVQDVVSAIEERVNLLCRAG